MSNIWFTADTHFGHNNIIGLSSRSFETIEEHDETLVKNWNAVVKPGDRIFHLGDFSLNKVEFSIPLIKRLNGQKALVFGNHDFKTLKQKQSSVVDGRGRPLFTHMEDYLELKIKIDDVTQRIVMSHFPMLTWNQAHRGSWMLHGHSHGNLKPDLHARRIDVGVDCWGLKPVSLEQIHEVMKTKTFAPVDHHVVD